MKYILFSVVAVIFIVAVICLSARKIAKDLVFPSGKDPGDKLKFPHEKRFRIQSSNGYSISCLFVPAGDGMSMSEKIVFILHPFDSCKEDVSEYSEIFTSLGYSVLLCDMRAHGESGGESSSMGYYERKDIESVVRWLKDCYGQDVFYGFYGLAHGGCSALCYAATDPDVKFVITDSSFGDLKAFYKWIFLNKYKVRPFPLMNLTELFIKKISGFRVKDISPISFFNEKNQTHDFPLMLIHGDSDRIIPPQFSVDLYNAKEVGIKTLYLVPECGHLEAFSSNREVYTQKIHTFIKENINE